MTKRFFCGAILALILAAVIAGCGSSPARFTLTVNVIGNGTVVKTVGGVTNDGPYTEGTVVDLTATRRRLRSSVTGAMIAATSTLWTSPCTKT